MKNPPNTRELKGRGIMFWPDDLPRFEAKVEKREGCWIWKAARCRIGYGQFSQNGVNIRAHVFSYLYHVGDVPEGMNVLHKCDNPQCSNPDHLFLGSHSENMRDKWNKGRDNSVRNKLGQFVSNS